MKRLLSARDAAAYCGYGIRQFRAIRRAGLGPAEFNPHGGVPKFAVDALDVWMLSRDDRGAAQPNTSLPTRASAHTSGDAA